MLTYEDRLLIKKHHRANRTDLEVGFFSTQAPKVAKISHSGSSRTTHTSIAMDIDQIRAEGKKEQKKLKT